MAGAHRRHDRQVTSELAKLDQQAIAAQRQLSRLEALLQESEERSTRLTDAKFVTYRTLIDSQAEKVKLALEATEKAIGKAEIATQKAIDKAEVANNDRFASVNEFRAQLGDLIARLATLERVDLLYNQTRQRMDEINEHLTARIGELVEWRNRTEGQVSGVKDNKAGIYAAIAGVGVLIGIVVVIANLLSAHG